MEEGCVHTKTEHHRTIGLTFCAVSQRSGAITPLVRVRRGLMPVLFLPTSGHWRLDHEPQHERHLSEEGGKGDVRDPILVLR